MKAIAIPAGTVFGRLTVLRLSSTPSGLRAWLCLCDPRSGGCGQEKVIKTSSLLSGRTTSCGCLHSERVRESNTTHGVWHHEHYILWRNMTDRCLDPGSHAYHWYGARGITVCPEWRGPAAFCAWMDANMGPCPPGMSFDRIRNDGNYEPGNVRWTDAAGQIRNSRQAKITMAIAEEIRRRYGLGVPRSVLAAEFGVSKETIRRVVTGESWVRRQPAVPGAASSPM
jgi:hypothetical protein